LHSKFKCFVVQVERASLTADVVTQPMPQTWHMCTSCMQSGWWLRIVYEKLPLARL